MHFFPFPSSGTDKHNIGKSVVTIIWITKYRRKGNEMPIDCYTLSIQCATANTRKETSVQY